MAKEKKPESRKDRVLKLVRDDPPPDPEEEDLSDEAMIDEMTAEASPADLAHLLREFPNDPTFVLPIYEQFLARGREWPASLKGQLITALERCKCRDEAQVVRDKS